MTERTPLVVRTIKVIYWLRLVLAVVSVGIFIYAAGKTGGESAFGDFSLGFATKASGTDDYNYYIAGSVSLPFIEVALWSAVVLIVLNSKRAYWTRGLLLLETVFLLVAGGLWWFSAIMVGLTYAESFQKYTATVKLVRSNSN